MDSTAIEAKRLELAAKLLEGRKELVAKLQAIPDAKIRRTLCSLDRLVVPIHFLTDATLPEGDGRPSAIQSALSEVNRAAVAGATARLKEIGYPGEATEIRLLYRKLAHAALKVTFGPYQLALDATLGEFSSAVADVCVCAYEIEVALLKAEAVLISDAQKQNRPPANKGQKSYKTKRIEKHIKEGLSNSDIDQLVSDTTPGAIAQVRRRMKRSNG